MHKNPEDPSRSEKYPEVCGAKHPIKKVRFCAKRVLISEIPFNVRRISERAPSV